MTTVRDDATRRDVLMVASGAFAAVGAAASLWPLLQQMNPDATTLALANIEVDLAPVALGQSITVMWRGKAVFIRHRTPAEIDASAAVTADKLIDKKARMAGRPEDAAASDANRVKPGRPQWLVVVGVCTHLGCVPQGQRLGERRGDHGGWFCSCHGSQYDAAGRVRVGPAPANLEVPPYHFITDTVIEIGRLSRPAATA
ncbi:MAG: ubiquinol-cytochrome c reductase iron-sulfur subunit [Hyphomicrobiaceae bacterium]